MGVCVSVEAILTSWRNKIWGHFQECKLARSEGEAGVAFGLEVEVRKLVIFEVVEGRKGWMPLTFQEKMRRGVVSPTRANWWESTKGNWVSIIGGSSLGYGREIRRRLRGGGLIPEEGMIDKWRH